MRSIILRFVYASVTYGTIFDIEVEKNNKKFTVFCYSHKRKWDIVSSIKNRFRIVA